MVLRIGMAQINSWVGDFKYNTNKVCEFIQQAKKLECDIVSLPELCITGYPPEDLIYKANFIKKNRESLGIIQNHTKDIAVIIGFIDRKGNRLYNSAALLFNKKVVGIYNKMHLPNYGVFDEKRYFCAGEDFFIYDFKGIKIGIDICEDIWVKQGPLSPQVKAGAQLIVNINASPYHMGKVDLRRNILKSQAKKNKVFIVYTNLLGGQDELVFDGRSMLIDSKGKVLIEAGAFKEELVTFDIDYKDLPKRKASGRRLVTIAVKKDARVSPKAIIKPKAKISLSLVEEVYQALVLGLKDYVSKNGFKKVVLGLSGGIDSSLVACLAVDALGKDNVIGLSMPSSFSSSESMRDAKELSNNLNIRLEVIPMQDIFNLYLSILKEQFKNLPWNVAEENLQARIRGNILMALSNKFGWLVLTTGNKSEVSVGYATLYGDMAGGFAAIKDVPKTLVYKLAQFRNSLFSKRVIPEYVITRVPSAELKENQKDADTLPEYNILDPILKAYIEENKGYSQIAKLGFDSKTVRRVIAMVDNNEYKRRQSPPGIKITPRAFGRDRRMPITNRFREE